MDLLIAKNPDEEGTLPFLLRVPVGDGLVFRVKDTWPRTTAVYCHPVPRSDWPEQPDLVERIPLRACQRRGPAIDIVADRAREHRSQLVFTTARGREVVFWQAPRTRKQARPAVRVPTARAAGISALEIVVDSHERYPYSFPKQQATTVRRALPCGDYAVEIDGRVVAAVERKSLPDLISSLTSGRLRYALGELASLPRAAVVVEDRYSQVFAQSLVRPAQVADGLAELQVRWPTIALVFCETRKLAEEWTYRYLAAAMAFARDDEEMVARLAAADPEHEHPVPLEGSRVDAAPAAAAPTASTASTASTAEIRAWALLHSLPVADRGRLGSDVVEAWRAAHPVGPTVTA